MTPRLLCLPCLLLLAGVLAAAEPAPNDLTTLRAAGLSTDAESLRDRLRSVLTGDADLKRIDALIVDLGADTFRVRADAAAALTRLGEKARAKLVKAVETSGDAEVRNAARSILTKIGSRETDHNVTAAAARVLAARDPALAGKTLLEVLPQIAEARTADELVAAFRGVGVVAGKPNADMVAALTHADALRRQAAAVSLASVKGDHRPALLALLKDKEVAVRRRTAMALMDAKDAEAVPGLISLLEQPRREWGEAEALLQAVAGEKAPPAPAADTEAARSAYARAWSKWWDESKAKIDLAKVDFAGAGTGMYVVALSEKLAKGVASKAPFSIEAFGPDGKSRWKIDDVPGATRVFGVLTAPDRVLTADSVSRTLTERDSKGKTTFTVTLDMPIQSLDVRKTGEIVVATLNRVLVLDRTGKEIRKIDRPADSILGAHYRPDGTFTILTRTGIVRLDRDGKVTSTAAVAIVSTLAGWRPTFLPSGNILIPHYTAVAAAGGAKVAEYTPEGKVVREVAVRSPLAAFPTADGKWLVLARTSITRPELVVVDPATGKELKRTPMDGRFRFIDSR